MHGLRQAGDKIKIVYRMIGETMLLPLFEKSSSTT